MQFSTSRRTFLSRCVAVVALLSLSMRKVQAKRQRDTPPNLLDRLLDNDPDAPPFADGAAAVATLAASSTIISLRASNAGVDAAMTTLEHAFTGLSEIAFPSVPSTSPPRASIGEPIVITH